MEKASETFLTVLLVWRWPPSRLSAQKQNAAAMDAFWEGAASAGCEAARGHEYSAVAKDDSFYPTAITVWGIML